MMDEPREAIRYVGKVSDPEKRFDLLLKLGYGSKIVTDTPRERDRERERERERERRRRRRRRRRLSN
jgi:hypothetical protein